MKYKIITNGLKYRILIRRKFLWFIWWDYHRNPEGSIWDSVNLESAKYMIEYWQKQDEADKQGWSEVNP